MAFLGHSARLLVFHESPHNVAPVWQGAGFEIVTEDEAECVLTDGQLFVVIRQGHSSAPTLEYLAASLQSVKDKLVAAGIQPSMIAVDGLHIKGPGLLEYAVAPATAANVMHRTGDGNPILGYVDALVVPVESADASAVWSQKCGYFIAEATGTHVPCVDVTDGIWMLSFREQSLAPPFLHYTADIDEEWIDQLLSVLPNAVVKRDEHGCATLVICELPGGVRIMITSDEIE